MRKKLKHKIEIFCAENSITQKQLTQKISKETEYKISVPTLHKWINGKDTLHLDKIMNLMKYLKLTPEDFDKQK